MTEVVRPARATDLARLGDLERAAGSAFRALGMDRIADDEPLTLDELAAYQGDGRCWVAVEVVAGAGPGDPIGYAVADIVDGSAHIEQVSVHPDRARRGVGRRLIEAVSDWARDRGLASLTLTTFAEVPWNAPYYRRLGFEVVPGEHMGPGLRRLRAGEAARGLDRWPRVAMTRAVTGP